jgi:hypothetical protein
MKLLTRRIETHHAVSIRIYKLSFQEISKDFKLRPEDAGPGFGASLLAEMRHSVVLCRTTPAKFKSKRPFRLQYTEEGSRSFKILSSHVCAYWRVGGVGGHQELSVSNVGRDVLLREVDFWIASPSCPGQHLLILYTQQGC